MVKGVMEHDGSTDLKAFASEQKAKDLVNLCEAYIETKPEPELLFTCNLTEEQSKELETIFTDWYAKEPIKDAHYYDWFVYTTIEVEE